MKKQALPDTDNVVKTRQHTKRWHKVVICLAAIVVFCTTYALILPAITMEQTTYCNIEAHQHSAACYEKQLVCGYDTEAATGHTHTEACYQEQEVLTCTQEESPGHIHDENCIQTEKILICVNEEEGHEHTEDCYQSIDTYICGMTEGEGGHTHGPECYETQQILVCDESEEVHIHTEACYEEVLICDKEEHEHSLACYSDPEADVETQNVWERTFSDVKMTGAWTDDVVAIAKSQLGYQESVKNYAVTEDGKVKGYTRYGAWYGDPYGDWCAMFASFCLHYAEVEDMPLAANCGSWIDTLSKEKYDLYREAKDHDPVPGELIFFDFNNNGDSDHVGIVAEVIPATEEEPAYVKTIEGNASNKVRYVTYALDDPDIMGYGMLPEQIFICGQQGHIHEDSCLDQQGRLICGLEEHIHTDLCKPGPDAEQDPDVETDEEIPDEEESEEGIEAEEPEAEEPNAEEPEAEEPETGDSITLSYDGPDYRISVQYDSSAALPEGVALAVAEIPADSEAYQSYYNQTIAVLAEEEPVDIVLFARFFDIQFLLDGAVLEPIGPVSVTITYDEAVDTSVQTSCQAIHFAEDGPEVLDVETETTDAETSFTHTQEGFSVVGNVVTATADYNETDRGPDTLPVDYYVCIDGEWVCVGSTKTGWYNNWNGTEGWTNYNRDYITVAQAVSILGPYGFTGDEKDPSRVTAYQQKSGNTNIYSDTDTVTVPKDSEEGTRILPLSRNGDHAGYNLYYLPSNAAQINGVASPDGLDKSANGFYTVKVYSAQGQLLTSEIIKTGGSFSYDATQSGVTNWLVAYGSGSTEPLSGSSITINNITSSITISPKQAVDAGGHSVTFKVMIDGAWKTVGSLPYYYTGDFGGSSRAYITSDMAAQFFGDFGYTATTAPENHFGYSYNDIYTLFYANGSTQTNFCMDVAGGTLQEAQVVQLYTSNNSDAQIFRVWDAGNGYSFITPIGNSALHVNAYGYSEGDPSSTQLKLSSAVNANSQWKVDTGSDGRTTFWSAIAPEDQVIDLNNADMSNGGRLQIWHSTGGARYWYMVQRFRISNNTVSAQNTGGTWNIGLTPESNGDIVCYYMPAETANAYTNSAESDISPSNSFWSVTVRDDNHAVYTDGELSKMVTIVKPGGEATVTVRNADGILWSCAGKSGEALDVESSQSDGYTTFTIKNITQPVEVIATKANPSFTVQYYANIPRLADSGGDAQLAVIDTSGKTLPQNGVTPAYRYLQLEYINAYTTQNRGDATQLFQVKTTTELTKMYSDKTFQFEASPGLNYFNKLKDNGDYILTRVGILKEGKDPANTNDDDWYWHEVEDQNIEFTNLASEADDSTILINDGAVIRLVSDSSSGEYYNGTTFYDYNISSGQNSNGSWSTGLTGINSENNYRQSTNGKRSWTSYCDVLAFGNQNCGTGMGFYLFDGGRLNAYNRGNAYGCTFSLVDGLTEDGTIDYDDYLVVPNLFNDGDATGKQTYAGSSLTFDRVGDTYTLSAATLNNSNGQSNTINHLQYFFNPSPYKGLIYDSSYAYGAIYTNNFWPMDRAANKTDALWGEYTNTGTFQGYTNSNSGSKPVEEYTAAFPAGDDGNAHNWFFGMNFALSFNLTADYEGPLEYYFFGDDDLWVFLDNQLVCDIGGVHSSVGEYVNLRDYLPVGSSGQHTLSFFYTERGASGSTCYMSFTLPSVSSATTSRETGSLQIEKNLEGVEGLDYSNVEYKFQVELLTSENGSALNQTFSYSRSDGTYGTIKSGGTIQLKADQTVTISGIPAGTFYRVTELSHEGYHTTVNDNEGYIVSGTIATGTVHPASFVNTPYYELPSTGGSGTHLYTISGIALMALALLYIIRQRRRRKEVVK